VTSDNVTLQRLALFVSPHASPGLPKDHTGDKLNHSILSHSKQSSNKTTGDLRRMVRFLTAEARRSDRLYATTGDPAHRRMAAAARALASDLATGGSR